MSDAETRALGRAAAILLVASGLRWGWGTVHAGVALPPGADRAPALLARSRELTADQKERDRPLGPSERIDPNRASAQELDRLPGLGAATARAIVAARERDGPFLRAEDLARVRGVGAGTIERIRNRLDFSASAAARAAARGRSRPASPRASGRGEGGATAPVGGRAPPTRIDVNRASAAELEALPGIGPALAGRILEARAQRPFSSPEDLVRVQGIGPATLKRLRDRITVGR